MRVLVWTELFWPYIGGAEIFLVKLILSLKQRGHEFVVITRQESANLPEKDSYKGISIRRLPFWTSLTDSSAVDHILTMRRKTNELKRDFSPELIHIHGFGPASVLFQVDARSDHPIPLLVTLINELPAYADGQESLKRVLRSGDWITSKSVESLVQARQLVPEITSRSSVIHNGLETPALEPAGLPFDAPRLLCLGRLADQKGFDVAVTALASIFDRFPALRLTIAGDGPERSHLERRAVELGLEDKVEFLGWVSPDDVPALINAATLVLMPSRWEGLPSVVLQASMMARPVVATPVGALAEVIVDKRTGLLVSREDHIGLGEAIAFLLTHPALAVQMGQAARRRVQERFNWEQCVDAYERLYLKLTEKVVQPPTAGHSAGGMNPD